MRESEQISAAVRGRLRFGTRLAAALTAMILVFGAVGCSAKASGPKAVEQDAPAAAQEQAALSENPAPVSVTADGVTLTAVESVIDGDTARITLRIEGLALPEGKNIAFLGWSLLFDGQAPEAYGGSFAQVTDESGRQSIVAADGSLEYDFWASAGTKLGSLSGREIRVSIDSFGTGGPQQPYQPLATGPWELVWTPRSGGSRRTLQPNAAVGNTGLTLTDAELSSVSARITLRLSGPWNGDLDREHYSWQLVGVRLKDGTVLSNIFGPPLEEGYADASRLSLAFSYTAQTVIDPEQAEALLFAADDPWTRQLSDRDLIPVPIA